MVLKRVVSAHCCDDVITGICAFILDQRVWICSTVCWIIAADAVCGSMIQPFNEKWSAFVTNVCFWGRRLADLFRESADVGHWFSCFLSLSVCTSHRQFCWQNRWQRQEQLLTVGNFPALSGPLSPHQCRPSALLQITCVCERTSVKESCWDILYLSSDFLFEKLVALRHHWVWERWVRSRRTFVSLIKQKFYLI